MKLKRMLSAILVVAMIFALAACGNSSSSSNNNGNTGNAGNAAANTDTSAPAEGSTVDTSDFAETPEYTLIFSTGDAETNIMATMWKAWGDKVYEVTKGRVQVEFHWNGELVDSIMAMTALQQGTIDVAFVPTTTDAAFQLDLLREAVNTNSKVQRVSKAYNEMLQFEDFAKPYEDYHVVALFSMWDCVLGTKGAPITSPADVAGKNIGVCSSILADQITSMGGSAVFIEPNGEYTNLEKGVVDGISNAPWDSMITQSWAEQFDYVTMMPYHHSSVSILMSKATWDSLPADIQEQIDSITDWFIDYIDETWIENSIETMEKVEADYGVELLWMTDEQKAAFQEVRDAAVAAKVEELDAQGLDASGFLAFYKETMEKYSADEYMIVPEFDWTGPIW